MVKETVINGTRLSYRLEGDGAPLVLVHGFGEWGDVWNEQVKALKNEFRILVPDLPGSGDSPIGTDSSMEGLAEVLKQLIQQEFGEEKVTMIGHSMGGYITLAFAEKFPNRLSKMGLFHSAPFADNEEKKETRKKGIEFIREHGAFAFLKNTSPKLFAPETVEKRKDLVEEFVGSLNNFSDEALVLYYEAMMARPDRSNVLKTIGIPVLVVLGKHDTAIPIEAGLKQANLAEITYIHVLESSGHMGMLEETEKSNEILRQFLTGD